MDDTALTSNRFGKLAENSTVLIEVTASDRENIDTQTAEIPQAWPKRAKVKPLIACGVREHRHYVPVAVGAMRLARTTTKQPYLFRLEHLEDAIHSAIRKPGNCHASILPAIARTNKPSFAPPQPIRCFLPIDGPSRH